MTYITDNTKHFCKMFPQNFESYVHSGRDVFKNRLNVGSWMHTQPTVFTLDEQGGASSYSTFY